MQETINLVKPVDAPENRKPVSWQRMLPAHQWTVRELKHKIAAYAYGNGGSAKQAVQDALPFLSKEEEGELSCYHGLLREKIQMEWRTTVLQANPDLKIDFVQKKFLFDSTSGRPFQRLVAWLGGYPNGILDKMRDGDSYEPIRRKKKTDMEEHTFTFEKRDGIIKAYRGVDEFVMSGNVAQEMKRLLVTDHACRELDLMLWRLSETALLLAPGTGSARRIESFNRLRIKVELDVTSAILEPWRQFEKLKSDVRKYIEGEPRQADEHTVLLPEWLEEAIIHLGMDEAKGLKLFGNQLLKRHFGEYCQRMQEMFPGWFGIETVDIYHFKKSELYLTESEIGPVAKKVPEILNEETEKMVGFILAAKGEIPENIGAARPIKSAMFNKVRKVCTLMDHIQDRHAELTGNKTRAGHAARSGYIEVYCPVLDKIDRAILDKELETSV